MSRAESRLPARPRYRQRSYVLTRALGPDEQLVLWPSSPQGVLELKGTALELWNELAEAVTVEQVAERLGARHGADADAIFDDVRRAVAELVDAGVIEELVDGA